MPLKASTLPIPSPTETWHNTTHPSISPSLPILSTAHKTILITGAGTGGIGARTALSFAASGAAHIGLLGRTESKLLSTRQSVLEQYPSAKVSVYVADVTIEEQVEAAFERYVADSDGKKIDVLVHCAGKAVIGKIVKETRWEDWRGAFDVNFKGTFLVTHAFLKYAKEVGEGDGAAQEPVLVYLTSGGSFGPTFGGITPYTVAKAAGVRLMESVQVENPGVRVLSLHPGVVETDMSREVGLPGMDDVSLPADFIVWLASPEAAFLKGKYVFANWDVDELKAMAEKISETGMLQTWVDGLPADKNSPLTQFDKWAGITK